MMAIPIPSRPRPSPPAAMGFEGTGSASFGSGHRRPQDTHDCGSPFVLAKEDPLKFAFWRLIFWGEMVHNHAILSDMTIYGE